MIERQTVKLTPAFNKKQAKKAYEDSIDKDNFSAISGIPKANCS